ncbi:MAG: RnfABCDGE type electron transport complex subunit D [Alkaliphilus sp.]
MLDKLTVSSTPHILSKNTTSKIMTHVVIALLPATIGALYFFRLQAAMIIFLSIATAVLTEWGIQKIRKQSVTINDMSAVVTGLLLGLNLSASVPWWIPVIGSAFAIIVVKQIFGGIGQNFMNPALAARIMLTISWTGRMTNWISPGVDAVSTATPLSYVKGLNIIPENAPKIFDMFIGNIGGSLGETSALLLIIGGLYLVFKRIISYKVPLAFIATVAGITLIYGGFDVAFMSYHIFSGGLMIGAIFMATDYSSTPITMKGRIIFALGCGIITSFIRLYGAFPEGVGFSILLMNMSAPLIEKYTRPRVFGGGKQNA